MHPSQQDSAQAYWIRALCLECGLCCNGVLFADVRLVKGDDPLVLDKCGLNLERGKAQTAFPQPCACFDGRRCTVYENRPHRCRAFDCHTLKQARAGRIDRREALAHIGQARVKAEAVRRMLRSLGQKDETLALTKRYQIVMEQPIDLSAREDTVELRGELMLAVNDLMQTLHRHFLK